MAFVTAGPDQFLLVGRRGTLENRGSAVQAFLWPGTISVLVPSSKQEATFELTQETRDGIPLRFKGIVVYRVVDPIAAARLFDFGGRGMDQVSSLLIHISLGELRHAVSHMTMVECIEQRKGTLSGVVGGALREAVGAADDALGGWGIAIEVAQVAQVYIVDPQLRQQLEAEVRNEIRLRSEQSDLRSREEIRLAEMASERRVQEEKLGADKDELRRREDLELADAARQRRMAAESLVTERQAIDVEREKHELRMAAERARLDAEVPVRRLEVQGQTELLREELTMRRLRRTVRSLEVDADLATERARAELRREILPIEQAPRIVEAASRVLQGTNLTVYGEDGRLAGQLAPVLDVLAAAVRSATESRARPGSAEGARA